MPGWWPVRELDYRAKAKDAGTVIAALRARIVWLRVRRVVLLLVLVAVATGGGILGFAVLPKHEATIATVGVGGLLIAFWYIKRPARIVDKLAFAADTLALLAPELHPNARVRLRLDLRAYDDTAFVTRAWKSAAGRDKRKYRSRWFVLQSTLADGTRVSIQRTVGVKVKRGSIAAERRKLVVVALPHPARYRRLEHKDGKALHQAVLASVRAFHDRPECMKVKRIDTRHAKGLAARVIQDDAPILPREVVAVVGAIVGFLGTCRHARRAA